jgi:hypothetical protein
MTVFSEEESAKNAVTIDIEKYVFQFWDVNLMRISDLATALCYG